ncbi:uncharacterized protein SCODWIG_01579 [Saccharomycodes ludwigii]|uniref:pH-response regulator protein palH/RIM21 n=1 Tax=Saccharomycodes ludwigii TaxID=36035 RepID=A0A376B554_9ASCO|nr:hypothetical protein SCDLUD_005043 [Saccharomycodes ludwigii]KAH3898719.1 hypothetical protein SCDLUD_005043 [Saccharomycodes ludwigii]SSD59818.1 uncharacterized protein SCODWIG_01579 [Saccharomycodes ludwigii]
MARSKVSKYSFWRQSSPSQQFSSCEPLLLGDNSIAFALDNDPDWIKQDTLKIFYSTEESPLYFQGFCYKNEPAYSAFNRGPRPASLPVLQQDWLKITGQDQQGETSSKTSTFQHSIFVDIYSITANLLITLALTIIVFIKPKKKKIYQKTNASTRNITNKLLHDVPSFLLYCSSLLASINFIRCIIIIFMKLKKQNQLYGFSANSLLFDFIWNDTTFLTIDFIVEVFCTLIKVYNLVRLYNRVQEKRLIFITGVILVIILATLWAITCYTPIIEQRSDIITPFVYLIRIIISTSYACVICLNIFIYRQICFKTNKDMYVVTLLAIATVLLQPGFFVADVANIWVDSLSMSFNTTCYLCSGIVVWEWIDRLQFLIKVRQAQSLLGRPVYEENELKDNYLTKHIFKDLKNKINNKFTLATINDNTLHEATIHLNDSPNPNRASALAFDTKIWLNEVIFDKFSHILRLLAYYADSYIIKPVTGKNKDKTENETFNDETNYRKHIGLDTIDININSTTNDRNIYLYRTTEIEFDDEEYIDNETFQSSSQV